MRESSYQGTFDNDQRDGVGVYEFPNGLYYSGGWRQGRRYGSGIATDANKMKVPALADMQFLTDMQAIASTCNAMYAPGCCLFLRTKTAAGANVFARSTNLLDANPCGVLPLSNTCGCGFLTPVALLLRSTC